MNEGVVGQFVELQVGHSIEFEEIVPMRDS
jgi:hypothetical protein